MDLVSPAPRSGRKTIPDWLTLLFLLVISLVARLWKLDQYPPSFFHDEYDNALNVISNFAGHGPGLFGFDWKPQPALGVSLQTLAVSLFGPGVFAMRLFTAIISSLAVVLLFGVARTMVGKAAALSAALLFSFHPGYLHFSRASWENSWVCFWNLLAVLGFYVVLRSTTFSKQLVGSAIIGIAAGASYITYFGGRSTVIWILLVLLMGVAIPPKSFTRSRILVYLFVTLGIWFCFLIPYLHRSDLLFYDGRTRSVSVMNEIGELPISEKIAVLASKTRKAAEWFFVARNGDDRYFPPEKPLFLPIVAALILGGMVAAWLYGVIGLIVVVSAVVPFFLSQLGTTGTPHFARAVCSMAGFFLLAAYGAEWLARKGLIARIGLIGVSFYLAFVGAVQYQEYVTGDVLRRVLEPAIALGEVDNWWIEKSQPAGS